MTENNSIELGIVVPCYNEQQVIPLLVEELNSFISQLEYHCYVLFINDGSNDDTAKLLESFIATNSHFSLISLNRNFGHQAAVSAGLAYARGDIVAVIDADLQDPLFLIHKMVEKWREGNDVVYGIRRKRKEGLLLKFLYSAYYHLLDVLTKGIPLHAGDFCLMDRKVVDWINEMPEHNRFVRGLRSWVGGEQVGIEYERPARKEGRSKYSLSRLIKLGLDGIFSFSVRPLQWVIGLGILSSGLAFFLMIWVVVSALTLKRVPSGWASLAVLIVFFGGLQLFVLGIIGQYIGRIYDEVKERPLYIVAGKSGWVTGDE